MHVVSGLQEIAIVLTTALAGGLVLERLKQPAILGYILAGILLGPSVLGVVTDLSIVNLLANLGVLMVLFVVGLNLNLRSFKRTILVSVSVASLQIAGGLGIAFLVSSIFGWSTQVTILFGFIIAMSSTAVAVKILENSEELATDAGRLTIGILIAQDLAIVPMMLILRGMDDFNWALLSGKILLTIGILSLLVWFLSRRQKVRLVFRFSADKPDLPALFGLAFCFGFAALSGFCGLSIAYGAFLGGLILGNSWERPLMLQVMMPIYGVLMMAFFLSIGLLIDFQFIWQNLATISLFLGGLMVLKTILNIGILRLLRQSWPSSFFSGVLLSQMGEFSFLMITQGQELDLLTPYQGQLFLTLTALSLATSPLWLLLAQGMRTAHLRAKSSFRQTTLGYTQAFLGPKLWRALSLLNFKQRIRKNRESQ